MEPRVFRQIHLAHAACADLGDDAVWSNDRIWGYALVQIVSLFCCSARTCLIEITPADSSATPALKRG
jgi:hypothetical protein